MLDRLTDECSFVDEMEFDGSSKLWIMKWTGDSAARIISTARSCDASRRSKPLTSRIRSPVFNVPLRPAGESGKTCLMKIPDMHDSMVLPGPEKSNLPPTILMPRLFTCSFRYNVTVRGGPHNVALNVSLSITLDCVCRVLLGSNPYESLSSLVVDVDKGFVRADSGSESTILARRRREKAVC
jgi:hypothetical protein